MISHLQFRLHEHSINEKPLTFGTDQPSIPFSEKVLQSAFDAVDEYILQWRDPAGGCRLQADRYGESQVAHSRLHRY